MLNLAMSHEHKIRVLRNSCEAYPITTVAPLLHRLYRNSGATVVIAAQAVQVTIGVAEMTKAVHTFPSTALVSGLTEAKPLPSFLHFDLDDFDALV